MIREILWALAASAFCCSASAQELSLIYSNIPEFDSKVSLPQRVPVSSVDVARMKAVIRPAARKYWHDGKLDCDDEFTVLGAAQGAFTRRESAQTAFLYRFCIYGHNFARNGIAVFERGVPIAHIVYEGAWDNAIIPITKLDDGTGRTKILTVAGGVNMGESWHAVAIIELTDTGVNKFGTTITYEDDCNASPAADKKEAYKLFVKAGVPAIFYRETYETSCSGKEKWLRSHAMEEIALDKNEIRYTLLPISRDIVR